MSFSFTAFDTIEFKSVDLVTTTGLVLLKRGFPIEVKTPLKAFATSSEFMIIFILTFSFYPLRNGK